MKMCTVYEIRDCELMRIMRRSSSQSNDDFVPIQLQQQRLRRSSSSFQNGGCVGVRRALFRERIDHEATDRYLRLQMSEIHAEARSRWNFDFGDDVPLRGRYEWKPVNTDKIRDDVHENSDLDRSDREVQPAVVVVDPTSSHDGGETDLVKDDGNILRKNTVQTKMTDFAKQRKRPSSLSLKSSSSRPPSFSIDTTTSLISKKLRRLASSCDDDEDVPSSSWVAAADSSRSSSSTAADGGKSPSLTT